MRHLQDLPNEKDFAFIGITHDGERVPCHVGLNPVNMHDVYRDDNKHPFFCQLSGWERHPTSPTTEKEDDHEC